MPLTVSNALCKPRNVVLGFVLPSLVLRKRWGMIEQDLVKYLITKLLGLSGKYEEMREEQNCQLAFYKL